MKVLRTIGMSIAAVMALVVPLAMAQAPAGESMQFSCPEMGPGHEMHMLMMSPAAWILGMQDQLSLNDSQIKQLTELDTQYKMKQVDRKAAIEKKVIQLRQASRDETMNRDQMKAVIDDIAKGYSEMAMAWFDAKDQAVNVLTPEQRKMVQSMRFGMGPGMMRGQRQPMMQSRPQGPPKGNQKEQ